MNNPNQVGRELSDADYQKKPKTSHELDSADADRTIETQREQLAARRIIEAEAETPEQRQARLENLRNLSERYGNNPGS